jgi:nucleoid-associated protein YgaU
MRFLRSILRNRSTPTEAPPPVPRGTYLVAPGDNLWRIARRVYGDANRWDDILRANLRLLGFQDTVHPGMTLRLP